MAKTDKSDPTDILTQFAIIHFISEIEVFRDFLTRCYLFFSSGG